MNLHILYMNLLVFVFVQFSVLVNCSTVTQKGFELSIIHFNDFHSRFESINKYGGTCGKKESACFGGFSRLYSAIMKLKEEKPTAIVLNAGDNYQGSLWYTYYKWRAVVHFLNKLPIDVHTIGNHEFDDEVHGVVPFLRNINAPVVVTNIDDSEEPSFQNLYNKSVVIERAGRRIGIIGAIVTKTPRSSRPGKLKFLDEIESINKEARRLVAENRVDTIIVLSHCGYFTELEIAKNAAPKIGLIVGGHSHSLLYNGIPPNNLIAHGPYPTVVRHKDGRNILVVQASSFTRFVAEISVRFDDNGNVISWNGSPVYLDNSVLPDPAINEELEEWQKEVDEYGNTEIGRSLVLLDSRSCRNFECSMGNFVADAMVFAFSKLGSTTAAVQPTIIALINSGALRNPISPGIITVANLLETLPYENTFDIGELQGKHIREALEHAAVISYGSLNLLQISGLNVVYNMTKPERSRVQNIQVRNGNFDKSKYEELDMEKFYTIVLNTFLVQGGDGFSAISSNLVNQRVGMADREAVQKYITYSSPITQTVESRIKFVK